MLKIVFSFSPSVIIQTKTGGKKQISHTHSSMKVFFFIGRTFGIILYANETQKVLITVCVTDSMMDG